MQGRSAVTAFPQRKIAEWLPAPPSRSLVLPPRVGCRCRKQARGWITPEREPVGEKLFMASLVAGAAVGIAYGFSLLIDLVENWAAVQGSIARMIQ